MTRAIRFRRAVVAFSAAAALSAALPPPPAPAAGDPPVIDAPRFKEVGRIPVWTEPVPTKQRPQDPYPKTSGWMVINPASRRGYTLTETSQSTVIQSFDLDTLEPRAHAVVPGFPIASGQGDGNAGSAIHSGDVVHAVDPVAKRIYLPLGNALGTFPVPNISPDGQRMVGYFLVIDEAAFDRDPARAFGTFSFPALQERLQAYPLLGMTVNRNRVAPDRPGKLLAFFASPYFAGNLPLALGPAPVGAYDHTLAQWDPSGVPIGGPLPAVFTAPGAVPVATDWPLPQVLRQCATAPVTAQDDRETAPMANQKNYQWGILARPEAVYLGCQSAAQSGAVVRVALDAVTGLPIGEQLASLGKPVGDVLVDETAGRLFLRSFGGGTTWWTFDAEAMRFTGSVAALARDGQYMAAGVDPGSGRLYTLTPDICVGRQNDAVETLPVRGGLKVTEAGLDPVPAPQNVVPELAYNSHWRIWTDPVTRRVFVRRGNNEDRHLRYPECDLNKRVPAPHEFFYRVYEDRTPLAEPPGDLDDSTLTTDVAEKAGLTQASYLGFGSGYGSRSLLIGGLDAPTGGAVTTVRSPCGRENREALVGSVGKVEVSDQSTAAEAAALDADANTQAVLGDPLSRCRPQADTCFDPLPERNAPDVREGAVDQAKPGDDENRDGCDDRDGDNRYAASCLGLRDSTSPGFDDDEHNVPRGGFEATARCDEKAERAVGSATGSLSTTSPQQADPVKVARSSSTVTVTRRLGRGVTVTVDSVARGVEITGVGTIGVVRSEAVSTATGRDRAASASFTRTICDVDIQDFVVSGCLGEKTQRTLVERINDALGGRGTARLRNPDAKLAKGTPHGYLAALQRDRTELFADQVVTKDRSLAVPGLEIVLYQGEGGDWGAGRQVFQLAGVQASTSYGIACTWGRKADGSCAADGEEFVAFADPTSDPGADPSVTTVTETLPGAPALALQGRENVITRLLRALPRAVAEALRLLFNNPRELGLLAALWALLYAPCYLGDRRRAVRAVAARRITG